MHTTGEPAPAPAGGRVRRHVLVGAAVLAVSAAGGGVLAAVTERQAPTAGSAGVAQGADGAAGISPAAGVRTPAAAVATPAARAGTPAAGAKAVTGDPAGHAAAPGAGASSPSAGARPRPAVPDDVDGDGRADTISLPAPGTLQVRYASGATDTVPFDAVDDASRLLGAVDVDRDGRAEVFVHVGSGAYTDQASLFRYVGGELRPVTRDGVQATLTSGFSVRNGSSWACRPGTAPILQWGGEAEDGVTYRGTLERYRLDGARLVLASSRPYNVTDETRAPSGCAGLDT